MTPKKYSERKREERQSARSETLGVVLIIASAFFLLCLITRSLLLGDVGKAIANVLLGTFGLLSYALFLFLLLLGVLKVKKRALIIKRKYLVGIIAIAISVLLIANLASSTRFIGKGFSHYIAQSYKAKNTVGGVIFGLINYPIYAVFKLAFSYVVFSLVTLVSLLFMSGFLSNLPMHGGKGKKQQVKKNALRKSNAYSETGSFASSGKNGGLFVGTIIRHEDKRSHEGSFDDMSDDNTDLSNAPESLKEKIYKYENAKKILFTENKTAFEQFLPKTEVATPPASNVKEEEKSPIPEIAMPAPKQFEHKFIEGEIINGDAVEEKAAEDRLIDEKMGKPVPPMNKPDFVPFFSVTEETEKPSKPYFNPAPIINGDFYETGKEVKYTTPYAPIEPLPVYEPTPITDEPVAQPTDVSAETEEEFDGAQPNDDSYEEFIDSQNDDIEDEFVADETIEEDEQIVDEQPQTETDTTYDPFEEFETEVIGAIEGGEEEEIESEIETQAVVEEDELGKIEETAVQSIIDEAELNKEEEPLPSFIDNYTEEPKNIEISDQPTEEEKRSEEFESSTTSFKISEEVEDLSESTFSNPNDTTGYYNPISAPTVAPMPKPTFENKVSSIDSKFNIKNRQIDIDTYAQHNAEKKAPEQPKPAPKPAKPKKYVAPPLELLTTESGKPEENQEETQRKIVLLEDVLAEMGVPAKVNAVTVGPSVTRYELDMPAGISVKKVETLSADIRYNLASKGKIRIETPIPGKRAVGIELPNDVNSIVALKDIIASKEFKASPSPLTVALGKDIQGKVMITRLDKLPHLLIAGATGTGKSCGLNSLLVSLIYKSSPQDVKFILIDPKRVEFTSYNGLPHMMIPNAITDVNQAVNAFKWAYDEMERRYITLQQNQVRNIGEYNDMPEVKEGTLPKMPFIVMIVDELANLITSSKSTRKTLEDIIMAIASKARAAGIHLVLATQRPSVDVITGTIKANLPSRIAFAVTSIADSRTILDNAGAELLLGKGDMLFAPVDASEETRIQGAFVENLEVKNIVSFVKEHNVCDFSDEFENAIAVKEQTSSSSSDAMPDDNNPYDEELVDVARCIIKANQASTSMIQRRFRFGWNKAARIMDQLGELNFIGPAEGAKAREVLATKEMFEEFFGEEL